MARDRRSPPSALVAKLDGVAAEPRGLWRSLAQILAAVRHEPLFSIPVTFTNLAVTLL